MARGSVKRHRGNWTARVTWTDPATGKRREKRKVAKSYAHACDLRDDLLRDLEIGGGQIKDHPETFGELAEYFKREYAKAPTYAEGRKVDGLRSFKTVAARVDRLAEILGSTKLRSITYGDLRTVRTNLLQSKKERGGGKRTIADVNRFMSVLRRMLNIARREGWIHRNPFSLGEPLITPGDERQRQRILSREEERRLLAACSTPRRQHLKPIIVALLDTGCRFGEILRLHPSDVDLQQKVIRIRGLHTKTLEERLVPVTERLAERLTLLLSACDAADPDARLFGVRSNVKRSFDGARQDAGIPDMRIHDLRHTAGTRMIQGGLSVAEVARILGHHDLKTTYRYLNLDDRTLDRGREAIEAFHRAEISSEDTDEQTVN